MYVALWYFSRSKHFEFWLYVRRLQVNLHRESIALFYATTDMQLERISQKLATKQKRRT